jgi:hypothetical protein
MISTRLDGPYHKHLDACRQCAARPFDLCPVGAAALRAEVLDAYASAADAEGRTTMISTMLIGLEKAIYEETGRRVSAAIVSPAIFRALKRDIAAQAASSFNGPTYGGGLQIGGLQIIEGVGEGMVLA